MTRSGWTFLVLACVLGVSINLSLNIDVLENDIWSRLTEQRILNWLGALSGWVAAAVAAVTLGALWRQVHTAQMQAQDTFRIQLRRSLAICHNGISAADDLANWASLFKNSPSQFWQTTIGWRSFNHYFNDISDRVNDDVFQIIEREIGFPTKIDSLFLRNYVKRFRTQHKTNLEAELLTSEKDMQDINVDWLNLLKQCDRFALEIKAISQRFVDESQLMISKYR